MPSIPRTQFLSAHFPLVSTSVSHLLYLSPQLPSSFDPPEALRYPPPNNRDETFEPSTSFLPSRQPCHLSHDFSMYEKSTFEYLCHEMRFSTGYRFPRHGGKKPKCMKTEVPIPMWPSRPIFEPTNRNRPSTSRRLSKRYLSSRSPWILTTRASNTILKINCQPPFSRMGNYAGYLKLARLLLRMVC
jgi:hypothetical protein